MATIQQVEAKIERVSDPARGGTLLDLLAVDRATEIYYSIEFQLGEIDASHSFRFRSLGSQPSCVAAAAA